MRTRARRPSWSNESIELNNDGGPAQHGIGCPTPQDLDSPSGAPSFTPGSLLADLEAQLAAASVSSAPLVPIVPNREYPAVIPVDLNWRDHPRWKPLITTPSRTPNQNDPLVPDRSPTPSAWSNCSDVEDSEDASPGSFIHRRRRKEYVHRAPVWIVRGGDDGILENDDPFMGGQRTYPIRQSTTLPNLGNLGEYSRCIAAQEQLVSGVQTANLPYAFDQTLEVRPVFTNPQNWLLSKDNCQALPALAGSVALRPRSLSKNADISVLDLNTVSSHSNGMLPRDSGDPSSQESSGTYCSSDGNSRESDNTRTDGPDKKLQPKQIEDATPIPEGYGDVHSAENTRVSPGSVVICLCPYIPARGDEFRMSFGDTFTVLRVFDDGWALCTELLGFEHSVERILNRQVGIDPPKYISKPNRIDNETEILPPVPGIGHDHPPQTNNDMTSYQDTITVTTKRTFPVALSPRTKFLPLFAVTSLYNFGRVIRSGTCKFGTVPTLAALSPDKSQPPGEVTLMIGDTKAPDRIASLQFNPKKQISCILTDRQSILGGQVGSESVRLGTMKVRSEPTPVRGKGDSLTNPSGKAPSRSRSSGDLRSTKSMKATLKRSFGTLRRKFTQAGDMKPLSEPTGKHVMEPVGRPTSDQRSGLRSDMSLGLDTEEKNEELSRRADARWALEKEKRQETLGRILPARDPAREKRTFDSGRLLPKISFSVFSLPGFSFPGFP
ncbi:MAG: hypothetical protein M1813_001881 [Trichoglossum hirsutum]|nr:MAG: hypothetical protein M1813_001881 [Trichoglossum hirsutum]